MEMEERERGGGEMREGKEGQRSGRGDGYGRERERD